VGGMNRVSLRLDGSIPQANLGAFLVDLTTGEPVIVVQSMELRPQVVQSNRLPTGPQGISPIASRVELASFSRASGPSGSDRRGARP
jgi:hypothetical protein